MFDRIVSIDWSGAGSESENVDLQIVMATAKDYWKAEVVPTPKTTKSKKWSRINCRDWLEEQLKEKPRTLFACDFGFGYPWGSDEALFGVSGWRQFVESLGKQYFDAGSSRAAAQQINDNSIFGGHGPFRFNENRNDFRFYRDKGIGYLRLTELLTPQAISQWYLGSGGTVGFHSISGAGTLHKLFELRDADEVDFDVWPFENFDGEGDKHLFAESYPSICPKPTTTINGSSIDEAAFGNSKEFKAYLKTLGTNEHQHDAWKALNMLVNLQNAGQLEKQFQIADQPIGRAHGVEFKDQIQFEGYILGLNQA